MTFWLVNLVIAHDLAKLLRVQHRLVGVEAYLTPVATMTAISITQWITTMELYFVKFYQLPAEEGEWRGIIRFK
jgi:hypothetical protein